MTEKLAWLNGWQRSSRGWRLEAVMRTGPNWETLSLPASSLLQSGRLFEPSARPFDRLRSTSFHLQIPDLTRVAPLLNPGGLLAAFIPPAHHTRQAVYAVACDERQVYLPAAILLRELWAWSPGAMDAMLIPNSLALCLQRIDDAEGIQLEVSGSLARGSGSDVGLRRLCWLAQCEDAQASWASVLTFAHDGALRLRLPHASLEAWAWGVELPTGILVTELSGVYLSFELPLENCLLRVGVIHHRCPPVLQRRTGLISF